MRHLLIAAALGTSIALNSIRPVAAVVEKKVDRFNDSYFSTTYTANPGECSRINNKSTRKGYQLICTILSVTFKNSYDRITNLKFIDSIIDSRNIAQVEENDSQTVYLLLTMNDGTQKQLNYKVKQASLGIWKNGLGEVSKVRIVSVLELHDQLANYLGNAKILEFRFSGQEYIWRLNPHDVRRFLEVSAPAPRPW